MASRKSFLYDRHGSHFVWFKISRPKRPSEHSEKVGGDLFRSPTCRFHARPSIEEAPSIDSLYLAKVGAHTLPG